MDKIMRIDLAPAKRFPKTLHRRRERPIPGNVRPELAVRSECPYHLLLHCFAVRVLSIRPETSFQNLEFVSGLCPLSFMSCMIRLSRDSSSGDHFPIRLLAPSCLIVRTVHAFPLGIAVF